MDTSKKILEASKQVFTKNGYLGSSTKEIAKVAGVAEMTLFRKFSSKNNLFETMIKSTLGCELFDVIDIDFDLSEKDFVEKILHNRLSIISKNIDLIRMIIQESILGRISSESNYISLIKNKVSETLAVYSSKHNIEMRVSLDVIISGILLQYVILTPDINYHILDDSKQKKYIENLIKEISFK